MKEYLTTAENLVVEIYEYNPNISDNFFQDFKNRLINTNIENLKKETKIRKDILGKLVTAVSGNEEICQVSQLLKIKGVGDTTLEKIFEYYGKNRSTSVQSTLAI